MQADVCHPVPRVPSPGPPGPRALPGRRPAVGPEALPSTDCLLLFSLRPRLPPSFLFAIWEVSSFGSFIKDKFQNIKRMHKIILSCGLFENWVYALIFMFLWWDLSSLWPRACPGTVGRSGGSQSAGWSWKTLESSAFNHSIRWLYLSLIWLLKKTLIIKLEINKKSYHLAKKKKAKCLF